MIHVRNVDDVAPIIGEEKTNNSKLCNDYNTKFHDTISKNMEDDTRKVYHHHILHICYYWEQCCSVYYSNGVRTVSEDKYGDRHKFYFDGKYKKDIVYSGINMKFLLSF